MSKTWRNPELLAVFGCERLSNPFPEGGGTMTDIDRDIEQRPRGTAHELALRVRIALEVQAADSALPNAQRFIVLHESNIATMLGNKVGAEGFREITTFITDMVGDEELNIWDFKGLN